jgi:hypothetical protein
MGAGLRAAQPQGVVTRQPNTGGGQQLQPVSRQAMTQSEKDAMKKQAIEGKIDSKNRVDQ